YGHQSWPEGRKSRLSVAQFKPSDDVAENLDRIATHAREAKMREGAELVVFPELAVTGLSNPAASAQPIPGPATDRLRVLAAELDLALVCGLAERSGDIVYNSACLVAPDGTVTVYRKIHLTAAERSWAMAGDE